MVSPAIGKELSELIHISEAPVASLYCPMIRAGDQTRQNPIRFKNLIGEAERGFARLRLDNQHIQRMLEPAHELLGNRPFWQHQGHGLAAFITPASFQVRRLPYEVQQLAIVDQQPYLRPLLPLYERTGRFYILVLSQQQVRLLEASRQDGVREVTPDDVPQSMKELLQHIDFEKSLQFHTGTGPQGAPGQRPAIFHGQGGGVDRDEEKKRLFEYFRQVDQGVNEFLHAKQAPLVLACVAWQAPIYRQANRYPHLIDPILEGNHEHKDARRIYEAALPLATPTLDAARDAALKAYQEAAGSPLAASDIGRILPGSVRGQIETLLVDEQREMWGLFEAERGDVTVHTRYEPGDRDLLELAALSTLEHGGNVHLLPTAQMPHQRHAAAIYRWPVPQRRGAPS